MRVTASSPESLPIFGPPRAWHQADFTASDDRVRGGSSQSYLTPSVTLATARFSGNLNTTTLGGAGFASQRTVSTTKVWDLSSYDGIEIKLLRGDGKKYTLNLKTVIPEKMENGRDASTVEYAYSFIAPLHTTKLFASWKEFEPYYRGKLMEDASPLDTSQIRCWSIMMRSFFETQSGPFDISISSIQARRAIRTHGEKSNEDVQSDDSDWELMTISKAQTDTTLRGGKFKFCAIL